MAKKEVVSAFPIGIVRIGTCPTISGRSELTYQVGCNGDLEISARVTGNSGGGQFNSDWVSLVVIENLLATHLADKPMTSRVLLPVFRSKSSNSPAFLFACLLAEGLLRAGKEKDSGYLLGDIEAFRKSVSALIATGADLTVATDTPSESVQKKSKSKVSVV